MAPAFSPGRKGVWREIGQRLEWLMPPEQLPEAEQATPNAFYTPPALAGCCWQILRGLGFDGGRILEPGCGAGAFMAATPADVEASWVGVERDPVTARIAQLLHPSAQIINEKLQNTALPAHSVDAVTSRPGRSPRRQHGGALSPARCYRRLARRSRLSAQRAARSRSARRKTAEADACDGAPQLALFDLPPPVPTSAHRRPPAPSRPPGSRK